MRRKIASPRPAMRLLRPGCLATVSAGCVWTTALAGSEFAVVAPVPLATAPPLPSLPGALPPDIGVVGGGHDAAEVEEDAETALEHAASGDAQEHSAEDLDESYEGAADASHYSGEASGSHAGGASGSHSSGGASGAHGGSGGEHGSHHKYHASSAGKAVGYMLIATVAFVMAIYYAVNFYKKKPRRFAWSMLSATMSIFIAVATWNALERLIIHWTSGVLSDEVVLIISFISLYCVLQVVLLMCQDRPLVLTAIGTIAGHMCGFSAISTFVAIQGVVHTIPDMVLTIGVFIMVMFILFAVGARCRKSRAPDPDDAVSKEERQQFVADLKQHHLWLEVCRELENDALTLALGLLFSQAVRFRILGYLPPMRGYPGGKSKEEVGYLLFAGVACAVALAFSTCVQKRLEQAQHEMTRQLQRVPLEDKFEEAINLIPTLRHKRISQLVQGTLAMTTTWIFIFWGQWQYYLTMHHDKMIMKTILAVLTSVAVFPMLVLFSLDCVSGNDDEQKALANIVTALGLLVGIAWEKAFDFSLNKIVFGEKDDYHFSLAYCINVLLCTLLADIIVGPAWAAFILPKAAHGKMRTVGGNKELWGCGYEASDEEGSVSSEDSFKESDNSSEE